MRIAYLCTDFGIPIHGNKGASIHVRELSSALAGLGHEVEIFSPRAGEKPPPDFTVPVTQFRPERADRALVRALREDPHGGESAAKELRAMLYAGWFAERALPALRAFAPDAIYERYSLAGTAGARVAKILKVPHIMEVNAPLSDEAAEHRGLTYSQMVRGIEATTLGEATRLVAVSDPIREWLIGLGVEANRISVLANGVDIERFAAGGAGAAAVRLRLGLGQRPVIGFVGTLKAWHGTASLIRAVGMLHRARRGGALPQLLIVGEGPEHASLAEIAQAEGIGDAVIFTGSIDHHEMPAHIAAMDIVTAPYDQSPNHYFSPLKLFEYMAAGRPIVAAGIGQIVDFLRDGETGLLYAPGNVASLAARLDHLLDDPAGAEAIGAAAHQAALAHHSWASTARRVVDLIADVVPERQPMPDLTIVTGSAR